MANYFNNGANSLCCAQGPELLKTNYLFQSKFQLHLSQSHSQPQQNPHHGLKVEATAIVVLNALGYIGFKVISTSGDSKVTLFGMRVGVLSILVIKY